MSVTGCVQDIHREQEANAVLAVQASKVSDTNHRDERLQIQSIHASKSAKQAKTLDPCPLNKDL